jgi:hypothetical protein
MEHEFAVDHGVRFIHFNIQAIPKSKGRYIMKEYNFKKDNLL